MNTKTVKEKILAAAEQLFWRYGVKTTTLDDVAKQLAISKKTIYQHFTDKEDLLIQVLRDRVIRDQQEFLCAMVNAENPVVEILSALEMLRKHADRVSPNLMIDLRRHYPSAWAIFEQYKESHILKSIRDNIQRGIRDGLYRSDINPDILARMRVEQIELAFNNQFFPADRYDMVDIEQELMHHYVRGLLSETGFTIYNQWLHLQQSQPESL